MNNLMNKLDAIMESIDPDHNKYYKDKERAIELSFNVVNKALTSKSKDYGFYLNKDKFEISEFFDGWEGSIALIKYDLYKSKACKKLSNINDDTQWLPLKKEFNKIMTDITSHIEENLVKKLPDGYGINFTNADKGKGSIDLTDPEWI